MSRGSKRPKLVAGFKNVDDRPWKIYHAARGHNPSIFREADGTLSWGKIYFGGRREGKIYVDDSLRPDQIFETTLHEMMHLALRDLGMDQAIEEEFVERLAARVAYYLSQIKE